MHDWAGSKLVLQATQCGLSVLFDTMQDIGDATDAEMQTMEGREIGLDLRYRQTQRGAQGGDQAAQAVTKAALWEDLVGQVEGRSLPASAPRAPALDELVFGDLDGLRLREVNDLASASECAAMEMLIAGWAVVEGMDVDASGSLQASSAIVVGFALVFGLSLALGSIGFDEGRRLFGAVLQFLDAGKGSSKLGLECGELVSEGDILGSQVTEFRGCKISGVNGSPKQTISNVPPCGRKGHSHGHQA